MRQKKTGHGLSHAGCQEAGSTPLHLKHSMQTSVFFAGATGFVFTVTVNVSTQYPQLHPQHPHPEQLLRRDRLHGSFFFGMPRLKHTADHTENPPSFDP